MEVLPTHAWLIVVTCLFQAVAVIFWMRERLSLFVVVQFSAAYALFLAAGSGDLPALIPVSVILLLPLVLVLALALAARSPWMRWGAPLVLSVLSGIALTSGLASLQAPGFRPRPLVAGFWDASDPLRMGPVPVLLQPRTHSARVLSHQGELRIEWPRNAGARTASVLLENAGPAESYRLAEGSAQITSLGRSRIAVQASFTAAGGTVRLVGGAWEKAATRILLIAQARGDLPALQSLIDRVASDPPDLIVLLGDMVEGGEYAGLLAVRNLVDTLGTRTQSVPGEGERGPFGLRTYEALFGQAGKMRQSAGISAVLLDTSEGALPSLDPGGISFLALMGAGLGTGAVFLHHRLVEGDAEGATNVGLLESSEDRKLALRELKKWRTRLVASTTDGPSVVVIHEGVQHVAVGRHEDRLEGMLLTMSDGRLQAHEAISVPRSGALIGSVCGGWHRLRAVLREHRIVGSQIALGLVGVPGCLLAAGGVAFIRRRRRRRDPAR